MMEPTKVMPSVCDDCGNTCEIHTYYVCEKEKDIKICEYCHKQKLDAYNELEKRKQMHERLELIAQWNLTKCDYDFKTMPISSTEEVAKIQKDARRKVLRYIYNEEYKGGKWLSIFGNVGTGKTTMLMIIANELIKKGEKRLRYITWTELSNELEYGIRILNITGYEAINYYKNKKIVMLDEMFTTGVLKQNEIFAILDHRYKNKKSTILATNENLYDIVNNKAITDTDKFKKRIASREHEAGQLINFNWTDYRILTK